MNNELSQLFEEVIRESSDSGFSRVGLGTFQQLEDALETVIRRFKSDVKKEDIFKAFKNAMEKSNVRYM